MKDELAGSLLNRLLTWSPEEQAKWTADLRRLATYKYDSYEGFGPGERFFESLARWLKQVPDVDDRRRLVEFILGQLVFISQPELNHAITCVYPDFIKRDLIARVAQDLGVSRYEVGAIVGSNAFSTLRRKTLYLGLSDGARLDRLRRSSPELSHEQFWLSPELGQHAVTTMRKKLAKAIEKQGLDGDAQFEHVVFIDDFYGSGTSLLHHTDGKWGGKLERARTHLNDDLRGGDHPLLKPDAQVTVIIYVASAEAERHISSTLEQFESSWKLQVIQRLPADIVVTDPDILALCDWFFDDVLIDEHKKVRTPFGYQDVALPLVLHHNTPNNSVAILWADSTDRHGSDTRHALFRRYERHHVDRP